MISDLHQRAISMPAMEREMLAQKWEKATDSERGNYSPGYAAIMKAAYEVEKMKKR